MAAQSQSPRPRVLADLYENRDLSPAQVRRLVALLRLTDTHATPVGALIDRELAAAEQEAAK